MDRILPPRLAPGDHVRVIAPSRSPVAVREWGGPGEAEVAAATARLEAMGLRVSFGARIGETSDGGVASAADRVADLHDAFRDDTVRGILCFSGGAGSIQMLDRIDYALAASRPKALLGYSDVGHLHLALLARTGLVGYYGPNFTGFAMRKGFERSAEWLHDCLFTADPCELAPSETWADDAWWRDQENRRFRRNDGFWCLQPGEAEGPIVGGGVHCLNALQGTPFFPDVDGAVLFLESPGQGKASLMAMDGALRSLVLVPAFRGVAAVVLGRFPSSAGVSREGLQRAVGGIEGLARLPILANVDFGHTTPAMTIPIGGTCRILASDDGSKISLLVH
jgi:muramoyltetrapeptide carboxypeptidase